MIYPLEIRSLHKTYTGKGKSKEVQAVKDASFYLKPGEIFGLLGPNGAGKTSIISIITTLEKPTSGEALVFGESVVRRPNLTKTQIGIVPQEIVAQGFFNLVEILRFHSGYYGIWNNEARIEFLLKRLSLWEHKDKQVKQLSGGMKRRMMIAKALVHSPKMILLDEPTAGVDIELRKSLWEFVLELKSQGTSVLLTTHYLQEAEELCDRIGIINRGELQYVGETKKIIRELTKRHVDIELMNFEKKSFEIPREQGVGALLMEKNIQMSEIRDLATREGTLEEAFLSLLGGRR
jgi:ABC-2 type transport system ATP-binding protein